MKSRQPDSTRLESSRLVLLKVDSAYRESSGEGVRVRDIKDITSHRLYLTLQEGKIAQGHFSLRKTSLNHTAIIKNCKERSSFISFVFKAE